MSFSAFFKGRAAPAGAMRFSLRGAALRRWSAALAMIAALTFQEGFAMASGRIQELTSPGGVEAWLVEEHGLPIISIELSFEGGAVLDPEGREGLAVMLTSMLDEGAGDLDATAFALRKDEIAARLSFDAGRDTIGAKLTMLADKREESLELFRLALNEPLFDAEPLRKVKDQLRSIIRQHTQDPNQLASKAFFEAVFPGDPYGRSRLGTLESIEAITAQDLREALPRLINKGRVTVGVVGAVTAEEAGQMLDTLLGGLSDVEVTLPAATTPKIDGGFNVVDFDAPQSTLVFGHEGIARNDPDFIPAYVLNYVLGGGSFSSRLTDEIREKRGMTYGIYSYLAPLDRANLYLGGTSTSNEKVGEMIAAIREEWSKLAAEGPTAEELDAAKKYLTGAYALRFDSNAKIANFLVRSQMDDLGIDYIDRRNDLVNAVTLEDLKRVAQRILKAEMLYFSIAGRPEGLDAKQGG